jgi:flavin reductase (DIM6/NTAB) family NADH-FMN oxidoreductase RutF
VNPLGTRAWVTTVEAAGVVNAAPFSFFNVLGPNPPIVGFCPGDREDGTPKDTALNIGIVTLWIALR